MRTDGIWGNIFRGTRDQEPLAATLEKVPLFHDLTTKELRILESVVHLRTYDANETVFTESEPGVGMYAVRRGRVGITMKQQQEETIMLAELESGDFFGEMALLGDSVRSATAVALVESELIGFFHPDLVEIINLHPVMGAKISFGLAKTLAERLRYTNLQLREVWGIRGTS